MLNVGFYIRNNRILEPKTTHRDRLATEERALAAEVGGVVESLDGVPWTSLESRVNATNSILREHSFSWLKLLDDVARVMPYDVRVIRISPEVGPETATLNLVIVAQTRDDLLELLGNLVDDPSFSRPTPRQEQGPEEADFPGYVLALSVQYSPQEETS
jgi:hypothetical protein